MGAIYSFIAGGPLITGIEYIDSTATTDSAPLQHNTPPRGTLDDFATPNSTIAVIGGGSMGCAVASWLAILGNTVCLIESYESPSTVKEKVIADLRHARSISSAVWPGLNLNTKDHATTKDSCESDATAALKAGSDSGDFGPGIDDVFGTLEECSERVHCYNTSCLEKVVKNCTIAIEVVSEDLKRKAKLFRELREANPNILLTTNSLSHSALDISRSAGLEDGDVIGLRWLWPICWIPLVEITTPDTEAPSYKASLRFLRSLGLIGYATISFHRWRIPVHDSTALLDFFKCSVHRAVRWKLKLGDIPNSFIAATEICVACLSQPPEIINVGACAHLCLCEQCAIELWRRSTPRPCSIGHSVGQSCPLCRRPLQPGKVLDVDQYRLLPPKS